MNISEFDKVINNGFKSFSSNHYEVFHGIGDFMTNSTELIYKALSAITIFGFAIILAIVFILISKKKSIIPIIKSVIICGIIYLLGYWEETLLSIALLISSMLFSVIVGLILGILISEFKTLNKIISPILDFMQTIPSFVYLIPSIMLLGIGKPSAILSIIIYSLPFMIRLTDLGITSIDYDAVESTVAYGANRFQLLFITKIPLAMRSIVLGINQTFLAGLSMVVTASMVGAGGIGQEVLSAINQINLSKGLRSGICIVLVAVLISTLTKEISQKYNYDERNNK